MFSFLRTPMRLLLILTTLAMSSPAWTQALGPQSFEFSFEPVKGAGGYLVEVKYPEGQIALNQTLKATESHVSVLLPPGPYLLRLTTLNRLGRAETSTEWSPIRVKALTSPVLLEMEKVTLTTGRPQKIELKVGDFARDMTVSLRAPNKQIIPAIETIIDPDGTCFASFDPLSLTGDYQLVIANSPDFSTQLDGMVIVHYPLPLISNVDPLVLDASSLVRDLTIVGRDFSKEVVVGLKPKSADALVAEAINLELERSETSLIAEIPRDFPKGDYEIVLSNGKNEPLVSAGTFRATNELLDEKRTLNTIGWISVTTGAVSTGVAITSLIVGADAYNSYKAASTGSDAANYRKTSETMSNLFVSTSIAGLTTLATGILLVILSEAK